MENENSYSIPLTLWGVSEYIVKAIRLGDVSLAYDLLLSKLQIEHLRKKEKQIYLKHRRLSAWRIRVLKL